MSGGRGDLGEPAVALAGLRLWVRDRQLPACMDPSDGNWLVVTARVEGPGTDLWVDGPFLTTTDLWQWRHECERLLAGTAETASLEPLEPYLLVHIARSAALGYLSMTMRVEVRPELSEQHTLEFDIDPSGLPELIRQLVVVGRRFPIR